MKLRFPDPERLIRVACVLALVGLALMTWSVVDPRVWPVLVALSAGQVIGTISLLLYAVVVIHDLGVLRRIRARPPSSDAER